MTRTTTVHDDDPRRLVCRAPHPAGPGPKPYHGLLLLVFHGKGTPVPTGRVVHRWEEIPDPDHDGSWYIGVRCPNCKRLTEYRVEVDG